MTEKYRKAVFIVAYSKSNNKIEYLLLKRKLHWKGWEFPKGGAEEKEKPLDAVKREVKEETGLKILNIKNFKLNGKYDYDKKYLDRKDFIGQTYSLYSAEVKKSNVLLDKQEHSDFKWLEFNKALGLLTWQNQKECLKLVDDWLNKRKKKFREIITSSGKIIYAGKNSKNNEELIKQVKKEEEVFHTKKSGSPFVNIKGKATKQDIKQAAIFCAKHSQDYRDNKSDVLVHWFKGKDIYKTNSMDVGTFGIKKFKLIKIKKQEIK